MDLRQFYLLKFGLLREFPGFQLGSLKTWPAQIYIPSSRVDHDLIMQVSREISRIPSTFLTCRLAYWPARLSTRKACWLQRCANDEHHHGNDHHHGHEHELASRGGWQGVLKAAALKMASTSWREMTRKKHWDINQSMYQSMYPFCIVFDLA